MKNLNADLKSGEFKRVYLLYGDEAYLKRNYRNSFRKTLVGDDTMNFAYFEGKDISEDAVIDTADTLPFFAEHRLILIEESGWFKGSTERLPEYIGHIPDTTVILFSESAVDKRNKLYKAVQKYGYAAELAHPERKSLRDWAARYLMRAGKKITGSTMDFFLDCVGEDMENAENELNKLISYLGDKEVAEIEDIQAVTSVSLKNRVFEMVRAITAHRTKEALSMYADLLTLKESPLGILYLIGKQYNQLLGVKEMASAGKNKNEIAEALKIPVFAAGRMITEVRNLHAKSLVRKVRRCVELEEAVKSGNLRDSLAVELLIAEEPV